jgi:hypothetical protein
LIARALFAVCVPGDRTDQLAQADYEDELVRNEQLRGSSEDRRQQAREETRDRVRTRISHFRRDLGFSFVILAAAVFLAVAVGLGGRPSPGAARVLAAASLFAFAWATLGRLGWAGKSWSGVTAIERLDEVVFRALYWFGTLLGTIAIL